MSISVKRQVSGRSVASGLRSKLFPVECHSRRDTKGLPSDNMNVVFHYRSGSSDGKPRTANRSFSYRAHPTPISSYYLINWNSVSTDISL